MAYIQSVQLWQNHHRDVDNGMHPVCSTEAYQQNHHRDVDNGTHSCCELKMSSIHH